MAFTPEEQAILSQLSYQDVATSELTPASLYDILTTNPYRKNLEKALGISGDQKDDNGYRQVLNDLVEKVKGKDYHIVKSVNDSKDTGFSAIAISDPDNNVTIACRGTEDLTKVGKDENSNRDALTDVQIGLLEETNQQQELEKFIDDLEKSGYDGYYFTGHSLGGNLAIHGAIYVGDPDRVKGVTTYNAPGFNSRYYDIHAMRILQIEGKIVNYENQYDIVSECFTKPGETVYLECNNSGDLNHNLHEFKLVNGGFNKVDSKSPVRSALMAILLNEVLELDTYWTINVLSNYIYNKITSGPITGYRDFSKAAMKTMMDAVKETEDEAWWRIDRWDCWYHADKMLGGFVMDFQRLSGNVDTYYRKVIDMNDASVKDIQKIFDKVYALDDTYSARIQDGNAQLKTKVLQKLQKLGESISPQVCPPR